MRLQSIVAIGENARFNGLPTDAPHYCLSLLFNCAMQCESVLRSIFEHVRSSQLSLSVVWRAAGRHSTATCCCARCTRGKEFGLSTLRLRRLLPARSASVGDAAESLSLAEAGLRAQGRQFQAAGGEVVAETPADFVSFNTDDNVYYRDEILPESAFRRIGEIS